MIIRIVSLCICIFAGKCLAQKPCTIYFLPGQGSDKRIFDSLKIDPAYTIKYLEYGTPKRKQSMADFARELSSQIDTTQDFILIGVSLGGMISVELSEIVHPKKVILISSVQNRTEFPVRYKFQSALPLYRIFPGFVLKGGARMLQPIVEPDRRVNKATFKSMLKSKSPRYFKRSIRMLISWKRTNNSTKIIRIHGTNDHTLPLRKIKHVDYIVEGGSHMMTLTRHKEISDILREILTE